MILRRLSLLNFRNYEEVSVDCSERINCFTGLNGSGKTNLLDAIHYLSLCKSFLNPIDSQNIRFDSPFFMIQGMFESAEGREENILCSVKRGQRKVFRRNGKDYERLSDHIGLCPLVAVSPGDGTLVTGGSEERRRFMDTVISQYNHSYLDHLIAYNRVLSQRNALLKQMSEGKSADDGTREILDLQLEQNGQPVFIARKAFIRELLPFFSRFYESLSGGNERVELVSESKMNEKPLSQLLNESLQKDTILGHTTCGIHKDDLDFRINGHSLKRSGSQGQQKTFIIALKLAEYIFLDRAGGKKPMLLLDDVHDKLDEDRVVRLMEIVTSKDFGQLFITDTGAGRMNELFRERGLPYKMFRVEAGKITGQ
ncbi:MAG TPA: DNA replication and repair protein RecF [Bacteroidia bacterium]|nr:DNA replication and repair protein RecF [Bacteroidia bacterium]